MLYALRALQYTIHHKLSETPNHSFARDRLDFGSDGIGGQYYV
jgi:hypothetical protein